jgi:DNA-binding NtrC family response regulator
MRGTRFHRPPGARASAAILLYANPSTQLPQAFARIGAISALEKAGFRCTSVADVALFEQALARGGWDVVIVDVADGAALTTRLSNPQDPFVLPIAHNLTGDEFSQARKRFVRLFKSPASGGKLVDAVDDAVELKKEARARANRNVR